MGEMTGVHGVLVAKPEGKKQFGSPRRRWKDKIKMDLQAVGWWDMDWIDLAQCRDRWRALVNAVMNLRFPYSAGNILTSCKPVNFLRTLLHAVRKEGSK
jgi:hypothetical protein